MSDVRTLEPVRRHERVWLVAIIAVALLLRVVLPWPVVFGGSQVNLLETDAWYHLRVTENLVAQFPHRLEIDPYAGAQPHAVRVPPLLDYLAAASAIIVGGGHPSPTLTAMVAAWWPPLLGVVAILLVWRVARRTGGVVAGLLAAAMAATWPGHFLDRTRLGHFDHHALEVVVALALVAAIARTLQSRCSVRGGALLCGVLLELMRLSWTSTTLIVAIIAVWLAAQSAARIVFGRTGGVEAEALGLGAVVALALSVVCGPLEPFGRSLYQAAVCGLAAIGALAWVSARAVERGWALRRVAMAWAGIALCATAALPFVDPLLVLQLRTDALRFGLTETTTFVREARPLMLLDGGWSFRPVWTMFRTALPIGLCAVVFLVWRWWRQGRALDLWLSAFASAMFVATVGVNRFGYYLIPALAIVSGVLCATVIGTAAQRGRGAGRAAVVAVAALVFGVNLVPAAATTLSSPPIPMTWWPAFEWMRATTPEPFGTADAYLARYASSAITPASTTVLAWWDHGYALQVLGRRVPVAIPTGRGAEEAARVLVGEDTPETTHLLDAVRARHVMVDDHLPLAAEPDGRVTGMFVAIAATAGGPVSRYFETFNMANGQGWQRVSLFFEAYYRSLAFRLGVLGGEAFPAPTQATVISWEERVVPGVGTARVLLRTEEFTSYEAARDRLASLGPGHHALVGRDPRHSPIPLPAVETLRRVFGTPVAGRFGMPVVQVFEVRR